MTQTAAVVRNTVSATAGGTADFTKSGFGTPSAAIIFMCDANAGANPTVNGSMSIGFWDGTNARACAIGMVDGVSTTATYRCSRDSFGAIAAAAAGSVSYYSVSNITDGIRLTLAVDNTTVQRFVTVLLLSGISAKVLTLATGTLQNDVTTVTGVGFAPSLVFFTHIGSGTADREGTGADLSFGFAKTGIAQESIGFASADASGGEQANILFSTTRCGSRLLADELLWSIETTAFGADGFTITARDGDPTANIQIFALALGGADLSFDVGTITTPTSTGASVISTSITPGAVLAALSTATGTALEMGSGANGFMLGLTDANGQFSHTTQVEDGSTNSNTNSIASSLEFINLDSSAGELRTNLIDAVLTSIGASSFTLNYLQADATARKGFFLAFANASAASGSTIPLLGQACL